MLLKDLVLNRPGTAVRSMHPPGVSTTTTLYAFKYCIKPYSILMLCAFKYCTNPRRILKLIFCTACTELSEEVKVQGINHALMAILCPVGSYRDQEVAIYGGLLQLLQHQDNFWRMFFTLSIYSLTHMKNNNYFWSSLKPLYIVLNSNIQKWHATKENPFKITSYLEFVWNSNFDEHAYILPSGPKFAEDGTSFWQGHSQKTGHVNVKSELTLV